MREVQWKIFYDGGATFSSVDGGIEEAPARGVQVIVQFDPECGWHLQCSTDYYVWWEKHRQWCGVDQNGLWDYLAGPGMKKVLFGRIVHSPEFNAVYLQAKADRDLRRKSSFRPWERQPTGGE